LLWSHRRLETREALAAGIAAAGAIGIDVGARLTGEDAVVLIAVLAAKRDIGAAPEIIEVAREIQTGGALAEGEAPRRGGVADRGLIQHRNSRSTRSRYC
jgi:hypothetical protein